MNFLGHSAVARWWSRDPATLFGAMLPDFTGMIAAMPPRVGHPAIARGVSLHHATDLAFHRNSVFCALFEAGRTELFASGVRRGTALAVAHVGVEILIDCMLARDAEVVADYLAAVVAGSPAALGNTLVWASDTARDRYERLHGLVVARGVAVGDPDPERVTDRLVRALRDRPRLALTEPDRAPVARWIVEVVGIVERALPALLVELRGDLESAVGVGELEAGSSAALADSGPG
ncbi:MAG: hypothetical protein JW751_15575 [Polyangiaceae bacterium]|nr:hypothetical protein [Polyangiaceae bacterium]